MANCRNVIWAYSLQILNYEVYKPLLPSTLVIKYDLSTKRYGKLTIKRESENMKIYHNYIYLTDMNSRQNKVDIETDILQK